MTLTKPAAPDLLRLSAGIEDARDLIDDLDHGRSVDPGEIDRALERANSPTP